MIIDTRVDKVLKLINASPSPLNTSQIGAALGLPRTTTEYILRKLEKAKYILSSKSGKATIWKSVQNINKGGSQIILGIGNIILALESAVNKKHLPVIVIENDTSVSIFLRKRFSDLFVNLNKKFGVMNCLLYILFHEKTLRRMDNALLHKSVSSESIVALKNRAMSAHLLPHDLFNWNVHVAAIGDSVFFTDFKAEKSTLINDKNLALFIKDVFELISRTEAKVDISRELTHFLQKK